MSRFLHFDDFYWKTSGSCQKNICHCTWSSSGSLPKTFPVAFLTTKVQVKCSKIMRQKFPFPPHKQFFLWIRVFTQSLHEKVSNINNPMIDWSFFCFTWKRKHWKFFIFPSDFSFTSSLLHSKIIELLPSSTASKLCDDSIIYRFVFFVSSSHTRISNCAIICNLIFNLMMKMECHSGRWCQQWEHLKTAPKTFIKFQLAKISEFSSEWRTSSAVLDKSFFFRGRFLTLISL